MDNNIYRYYLTQRPPSPGAIPNKFINAESFDDRTLIGNHKCWGWVEYDRKLSDKEISDYELTIIDGQ